MSAFCLRLRELFEELEELEGEHAFVFNDTQRLGISLDGYSQMRSSSEASYTYITSEMNRGTMTFELAVADLGKPLRASTRRCSSSTSPVLVLAVTGTLATAAQSLNNLDSDLSDDSDSSDRRALVSTQNKRHESDASYWGGG